jgi:hypothetical protein
MDTRPSAMCLLLVFDELVLSVCVFFLLVYVT